MSVSLRRASLSRLASVLASAPILVALAACHATSSPVHNPSAAEPIVLENGRRSSDERLLPSFPGVHLMRMPSGGFVVRILSSFVSDGPPLYVIDGAPATVDSRRGIDWLKLEDVATIRVLKDPVQTAVYGPSGANGVIVITTKLAAAVGKRGP